DSTIMLMGAIVKIHWVFSFLVWSPSSLAKLARLGRRLNEYQSAALAACGRWDANPPRGLSPVCLALCAYLSLLPGREL
ncbi:hypothetical protein, partial [Aliidiomarina maris]|uniref:hypothetical protein n=1 Tax=Aliidiomarina maris TaxID=531312 RepID=UPI001A7E0450